MRCAGVCACEMCRCVCACEMCRCGCMCACEVCRCVCACEMAGMCMYKLTVRTGSRCINEAGNYLRAAFNKKIQYMVTSSDNFAVITRETSTDFQELTK